MPEQFETVAEKSLAPVESYVKEPPTVYWLKPEPVKVTVVEGSPALSAAADVRLDAVTIGASEPASPTPKAPVADEVAPLPPTVGLVTVTLHCSRAVPVATVMGTVSDVALETVAAPTDSVPAQVNVTVAPNSKPAPVIVTFVVDDPDVGTGTAEGLSAVRPKAVMVKPLASVELPPSAFVTVMS